ncbi:MAG: hypothetical protein KBG33_08445 [Paludibacteraceae bacterium]|nr:hypothetical protein [Paludibacteraceae bacterium]HOF99108.1 hypothetical protein [Paludibacteraceae bacterium]HOR39720.1 hypothetical protein [Paludibacteraceae bacterium]HPD59811.1 hypothetical protein [Paludibacteraceae bacterium]HPL76816.1 hypothetical protein [Paludibacteraceae bacterium]
MPKSYFRIKEKYRDIAEVVRSRILLVSGFILELDANQRKQVDQLLTYWKQTQKAWYQVLYDQNNKNQVN